jgi:hypothetical protein
MDVSRQEVSLPFLSLTTSNSSTTQPKPLTSEQLYTMGADQSHPTDSSNQQSSSGAATPSAGPDDFYTLLGVDEGAGELEIKVRASLLLSVQ